MSRTHFFPSFLLLVVVGIATLTVSNGKAFAQNRLFVTVDEFTGSSNATDSVGEVDLTSGMFDFTPIFVVPTPPNGEFRIDGARDLVVDEQGNIQVFNGRNTVSLLLRDASDGSIAQAVIPGLSLSSSSTDGGIARQGDLVFLADQSSRTDPTQGIVRVDLANQSFDRIATDLDGGAVDINIGLDGTLLAIEDNAQEIFRYDGQTGELLNVIELMGRFSDIRGVAGLADGTVFAATFGGDVVHFDDSGNVLGSLEVNGRGDSNFSSRLHDIDIAPDGQIALGTSDGDIILTTTALESFEVVSISDQISVTSGTTFVTFASDFDATTSVPEPSAGLAVVVVGLPWLLRRRKLRR